MTGSKVGKIYDIRIVRTGRLEGMSGFVVAVGTVSGDDKGIDASHEILLFVLTLWLYPAKFAKQRFAGAKHTCPVR